MCITKGLSGGYLPVAATVVTPKVFAEFAGGGADGQRTFFHGHTFTGNALGCAASLANIEALEALAQSGRVAAMIERLDRLLAPLADHDHVLEVRHRGLMTGVELARSDGTPYPTERRIGHDVAMHARRLGVLLRPLGPVMILMPPFSFTDDELDRAVEALTASIDAVCAQA